MRKGLGLSVACLFLLGLAAGCGDEEIVEVEKEPVIKVSVTATPDNIESGGSTLLKTAVTVLGETKAGSLEYAWKATGGDFTDADGESTTWYAPEDAALFSVSVVVTDGEDVGIGSARVMVGDYVPTDDPVYVGVSTCGTCHGDDDEYTEWLETGHAGAYAALADIGREFTASCLECHTVGSYTLGEEDTRNNGGYDELAVERLRNVQCENCHGPGGEHVDTQSGSDIHISYDAAVCGVCHTDAHHPTYDEWQESAHGNSSDLSGATRTTCVKCHNGYYAADYLDDPAGFSNPSSVTETEEIVCATCHDPHGNDNPANLRNAANTGDEVIPNDPLVPSAGAGRLCIACHNGRRDWEDVDEQIAEGSAHFGPHHAVQGDMLAGVNAYEGVDSSFTFATSRHILVEDGCVHCHTHAHDAESPTEESPNYTGHTFEPTVEACYECHGTLSDFSDVMAKKDFDGNGSVEGVQDEVEGLLAVLREVLTDATANPTTRAALEAAEDADFAGVVGDTLYVNDGTISGAQRKAAYNHAFVEYDGSMGVHNATYAVQLLQQSIERIDPDKLESLGAFVLKQP
ncbi:MAG: cytochrome c3 family protein [Candidatus Eisenbacteria bacterium]